MTSCYAPDSLYSSDLDPAIASDAQIREIWSYSLEAALATERRIGAAKFVKRLMSLMIALNREAEDRDGNFYRGEVVNIWLERTGSAPLTKVGAANLISYLKGK